MFYYPCVLERQTGCFATIWLAATKGIKIQRREFLKVNVKRTCDDIMDYVLVRVPPPQPGLPRPRFSLYLSAQLQYGTVIVYHHQCAMLLEEIQSTVARLTKPRSSQRIDMEDPGRQSLDQDALFSMEEHEWANDPFFGQMHSGILVPSPGTLVQLDLEVMRRVSPEHPLLSSPGTPPLEGLTASSGSITLLEREPASLPSSQQFEGAELAEVTDAELGMIELLMDQSDHFPESCRPLPFPSRTPQRQGCPRRCLQLCPRRCLQLCPGRGPLHLGPARGPLQRPPGPSSPPGLERRKDVAAERERPELLPSGRTQTRRRRGRRQLLFMDEHTQISQDVLRRQLDNHLIQTQSPVFVSLPSQTIVSPYGLLNKPCSTLPPDLLLLWQQAAIISPLLGSDLLVGERGTDSDSERERERVGDRGEEDGEIEEEKEISSKEVLRELAESGLSQPDLSAPSLLTMEVSDREGSHDISLLDPPESQGSSGSGRSVSRLMDIPEEAQAPLGREEAQVPLGREEAQVPLG
ncbi:meiotic recombination protein REC8 homolog, partial [Hypomesus transpacificus]|uniref:meiotic recombination protein REC8 homolog n=1 Tax=Hypomesus transpacificus TaxID=137520 RepID=UPI001F07D8D8